MSDSFIQLPVDSTGKKVDTELLTVSAQSVHRERMQIAGAADVDLAPVDATDGLKVNLGNDNDVTIPGTAAESAALPAQFIVVAGDDGVDTHPLQQDGTGRLKVSLDSQALPAGGNNIGDVDVLTMPGTAAEGVALPSSFVVVAGDDGTDTHPLQVAVDGDLKVTLDSETITIGAELPAGTNNIGDVDIASELPAGTQNIGDVDVATIAAGDNNIGNVDIVSLPSLVAGSANIGDVDVATLPALPTGTNKIGIVGKDIISPYDGSTVLTVAFAEVDAASSGDNAIVAAAGAGNRIIVLSVVLVASGGANTCEWRSATTPISGGMGFAEFGGYSVASEFGLFETGDNVALNLNLSAATSVDGHIAYVVA
jgi:hypothetical protein